MFQNSVPRASSMPRWKPDLENGWHGNPAASTSCSEPASPIGVVPMSPGVSPQLRS